jgi:hypothetical protein
MRTDRASPVEDAGWVDDLAVEISVGRDGPGRPRKGLIREERPLVASALYRFRRLSSLVWLTPVPVARTIPAWRIKGD